MAAAASSSSISTINASSAPQSSASLATASAATVRQRFNTAAHNNDVDAALGLYSDLEAKQAAVSPYIVSLLLNLCANAATGQTAPMTANRKARKKGELRTPASMLADSASAAAPGGGPTFVREPGSSALSPAQLLATAQRIMQRALDAADKGDAPVKETSFSSIIRTACGCGQPHIALSYIAEMRKRKTTCKARSFLPILAAFAAEGDAAGARCALQAMQGASVPLTEQAYRSVFAAVAARLAAADGALRAEVDTQVGPCKDDTATGWREYAQGLLVQMTHDIYQLEPATADAIQAVFTAAPAGASSSPWLTAEGAVDASGVFSPNGHRMRSVDLTTAELSELASQARDLACTSERRTTQFKAFESFLEKAGPIDILIDGANLGFFNQNFAGGAFSHAQIDAAVRHFAAQGLRVAVVLHSKWLSAGTAPQPFKRARDGSQKRRRDGSTVDGGASAAAAAGGDTAADSAGATDTAAASAVDSHALAQQDVLDTYRQRWLRMGLLYEVQRGNNDDWYWLYAAVTVRASDGTQRSVRVVSNDQMRDHHFKMLAPENFLKWRERHQVTYHIMSFQKRSAAALPDDDYSDDEEEEHHSHATLSRGAAATSSTEQAARAWVQAGSEHLHGAAMAREAQEAPRPEHGDSTCDVQRSYVHCEVQPHVALSSRFNMPGRYSVRLQAGAEDGSGGWYIPLAQGPADDSAAPIKWRAVWPPAE